MVQLLGVRLQCAHRQLPGDGVELAGTFTVTSRLLDWSSEHWRFSGSRVSRPVSLGLLRSPGGLRLAVGDDDTVVIADHDHCRHPNDFADRLSQCWSLIICMYIELSFIITSTSVLIFITDLKLIKVSKYMS